MTEAHVEFGRLQSTHPWHQLRFTQPNSVLGSHFHGLAFNRVFFGFLELVCCLSFKCVFIGLHVYVSLRCDNGLHCNMGASFDKLKHFIYSVTKRFTVFLADGTLKCGFICSEFQKLVSCSYCSVIWRKLVLLMLMPCITLSV